MCSTRCLVMLTALQRFITAGSGVCAHEPLLGRVLAALRGALRSHGDGGQRGASPSSCSLVSVPKPGSTHGASSVPQCPPSVEHRTPRALLGAMGSSLLLCHRDTPLHHSFGVAELPREAAGSLFVWCRCQQRPAGSFFAILGHQRLFPARSCCGISWARPELPLSSHSPGQAGFSQSKKHFAWTQVLPVLPLVTVTWLRCPQCSWLFLSLPCKVLHPSIPSEPQGLPTLPGFDRPARDFGSEKCCCCCSVFLDSFFLPQPV